MTAKQINSEIEYRLAKWVAFNLLQQGLISIEEYEKACADFLLRFNPPTSCFENNGDMWKSIISRETFRAVQEMRESRSNIERHADGTITRKSRRYTGKKE